jgi:hypothetical protein
MHGQKKRRKRLLEGTFELEGTKLCWRLVSEPQLTSEGYRGVCISVRAEDEHSRELVLEYPMPEKTTGNGSPQLPQRPTVSAKQVEFDTRLAMRAGWNAMSRGKPFVFEVR